MVRNTQVSNSQKLSLKLKSSAQSSEVNETSDPEFYRSEFKRILELRNKCIVELRGLPARVSISTLNELVPDAKAFRIPWMDFLHRSRGLVYLEFETEQQAIFYKKKLNNYSYNNGILHTRMGCFLSENPGNFVIMYFIL